MTNVCVTGGKAQYPGPQQRIGKKRENVLRAIYEKWQTCPMPSDNSVVPVNLKFNTCGIEGETRPSTAAYP